MAPVEPDATARSNTIPLALFSGQILLVAGLTTHVLYIVVQAARTLRPSSSTRAQDPVRRRHVAVFSTLAFLSLASVTTFSVIWRIASYFNWAETGSHETPGGIWSGWYGTGEEGVGRWRLGDWATDVDLVRESETVAISTPEGFLYTTQHFAGLAIASVFFGIEGRRRNISTATVASFVLLSASGSLGYALNLFFILILYTPVAQHSDESRRRDALFAPKSIVYYVPVVTAWIALNWFPTLLLRGADVSLVRAGYYVLPLFLTFAPQVIPSSWGHEFVSKTAAHRSFVNAFWILGTTSMLFHWKQVLWSFLVNTPQKQPYVYELLRNAIGKKHQDNRFYTGLANTARRLQAVSSHPAVSVTASDVLFTAISLAAWAFFRNLDVNDVLENSILSPFSSSHKSEKHVAFEKKIATSDNEAEVVPRLAKKRGRPKKSETLTNGASAPSASSTGSMRRSTRRKAKHDYESDAESAYEPTREVAKEVEQIEADSAQTTEDLLQGGETTALAIFLAVCGSLGSLAAGVLGAEVTGGPSTHD